MEMEVVEWKCVGTWKYSFAQDTICSICQLEFERPCPQCKVPGENCIPIVGACRHIFHLHCIDKWIKTNLARNQDDDNREPPELCPNCRSRWEPARD